MKTVINIKADQEVKEQATKVARDMGVPLSTVVNAFLKQFISQRQVTFRAPLKPSPMLEKILDQADRDIKAGKNLSPAFKPGRELDDYLASL